MPKESMPAAMPVPEWGNLPGEGDLCVPPWVDGMFPDPYIDSNTASVGQHGNLCLLRLSIRSLFFMSSYHVHSLSLSLLSLSLSFSLFLRVRCVQSAVQRAGLVLTVPTSVCVTTGATATLRQAIASVLKASLETGVCVYLTLCSRDRCMCRILNLRPWLGRSCLYHTVHVSVIQDIK